MCAASSTTVVLDYEDGTTRRRRSRTATERWADVTAQCAISIVGCAFVAGLFTDRSSTERALSILAIFICAVIYVIARVVMDDIGRAAIIHMFVSGVPALIIGINLLVPIFVHLRDHRTIFLEFVRHDTNSTTVMLFVLLMTWFIVARVCGAGAYRESKRRFG